LAWLGGSVAELIAAYLAWRGVRRVYGLCGGHIQPIWDALARLGVSIADVRHEAAAVYMAHAEAELTGKPAVAMVDVSWLTRDERFHGLILVSGAIPDVAVREIERLGRDKRMVGVAIGANALNLTFGHPVYFPILRAAAEQAQPVILQALKRPAAATSEGAS
jgi:predicted TIM-barrel fold metal-dependent hydrolase